MQVIRIYLYSKCSTCRDAEKLLLESGKAIERRDIFRNPLSATEISELLHETGTTPGEILSSRSISYRQLGLAGMSPTDEQLVDLMANYPGLIRRPIIIMGDSVQIGFNREALIALVSA